MAATTNTTFEKITSKNTIPREEMVKAILQSKAVATLDQALMLQAKDILNAFFQSRRQDYQRNHVSAASELSLSKTAIRVADVFVELASSGKGSGNYKIRKALEDASNEVFVKGSSVSSQAEDSWVAARCLSIAIVSCTLALGQESDRDASRAAVSAMGLTLQQGLRKTEQNNNKVIIIFPAGCILQALLKYCAGTTISSQVQDDNAMMPVDWHVVTSVARALDMDGSQHPGTRQAVATLVSQFETTSDKEFEILPEKTAMASALALAAQLKPWEYTSPVRLIKAGVAPFDLWHAGERVCASVATCMGPESPITIEAVESLIDEAIEAKTYRRADTFATQFYDTGGKSRFLQARLLHACDTVAKVVRKGALPVMERQITRIDKSADRAWQDKVVDEGTALAAKEEIRNFALQQSLEAGHIDAAHRLARIYNLEFVDDKEALAKAYAARREKYLQWEELFPGTPPNLISTSEGLLDAFSKNQEGHLYGFDVEWSDDDQGAALLQIAFPNDSVILIDIPALSMSHDGAVALEKTVGRLFTCERSIVVGFGCRQDAAKLRASPCLLDDHWFKSAHAVVDLQQLVGEIEPKLFRLGLSRVCDFYLGKPLDKSEQCSFWSARPLSIQQRIYAALDAWVCLAIHRKIVSNQ